MVQAGRAADVASPCRLHRNVERGEIRFSALDIVAEKEKPCEALTRFLPGHARDRDRLPWHRKGAGAELLDFHQAGVERQGQAVKVRGQRGARRRAAMIGAPATGQASRISSIPQKVLVPDDPPTKAMRASMWWNASAIARQ